MIDTVLSVLVLAVFVLLGGAVLAWRKGLRRQALLLALLALVVVGNVAVWVVPGADGVAPVKADLK